MEMTQLEKRITALEAENQALKREYGLNPKHPYAYYLAEREKEFKKFIDAMTKRGVEKYIDRETMIKRIEKRISLKWGTTWAELLSSLSTWVQTASVAEMPGFRACYRKELFPGGSLGLRKDEVLSWELGNFTAAQRAGRDLR